MTWNVRSLRDNRSAVVAAVREIAPDVLFLQEAPRFLRSAAKLAALARESGLVVGCGGRSAAGVGLLTSMRVDVDLALSTLLPATSGLHQRGVAVASLRLGGRAFAAASVHLGLEEAERVRHAKIISELLSDGPDLPAVLGGDLNETSDGQAWATLADGATDAGAAQNWPTFPARQPRRRIDAIFVPVGWRSVAVSPSDLVDDALLARATDHLPVIVDVVD